MNDIETLITIDTSPKAIFTPLQTMRVERGDKKDWEALHELHYKSETAPVGPHFWRCVTEEGGLVGLVVFSPVSLLLGARHRLFPRLKPGNDTHFTNVHRGRWLNQNFRRAARIVTDTQYRGVGVSYRMLNLANRLEGYKFVEIQSSMSKFNPFDHKAGFRHGKLANSVCYDHGINFFRTYFQSHPADHEAVLNEFRGLPQSLQDAIDNEMRAFYWRHSAKEKTGGNMRNGTSRVDNLPVPVLIKELQQLIFASPCYGIYLNPDVGRTDMPDSLPLSAFDLQAPDEPLRVDLL